MSSWFKPYCPCDPAAKVWIEKRLRWVTRRFPSNIFSNRPLVLPTTDFFPEQHEPSKEAAKALLLRICRFMDVPQNRVILKFHHEANKIWYVNDKGDYLPHAAGTYSLSFLRHIITLDMDELHEAAHLVATMVHELAHARLLGEGKLRGHGYDDELLTDLTAFCLGFALFMANSVPLWVSLFSKWPGTRFNKPEYMTAPMYGYALAHLAWHQDTPKPSWKKYLGSHVVYDFKDATRYLFETGDSSFAPGSASE